MPIQLGPHALNYQHLLANQMLNEHSMYSQSNLNGTQPPQLISQASSISNLVQPTGIIPISTPSVTAKTPPILSNLTGTSSNTTGLNPLNNVQLPSTVKPQSPFHHPQLLHHLGSTCKYYFRLIFA